jgi:hypothetical protein
MKINNEHVTNTTFDSSLINDSSYSHENKTMIINLSGGKKYKYFNVDEDTFNKFVYSDSQGVFFDECIRDKFDYKEIVE